MAGTSGPLAAALAAAVAATLTVLPRSGATWSGGTGSTGSWSTAATFTPPDPPAGATFVRAHPTSTAKTAGASNLAVTLAEPVPAGRTLLVWVASDNASTTGGQVSAISTASGESATWVRLRGSRANPTTAAASTVGTLMGLRTTVPWPTGTYPITLSASTVAKVAVVAEFTGVSLTPRYAWDALTTMMGGPLSLTDSSAVAGDLVVVGVAMEQGAPPPANPSPWADVGAAATTGGFGTDNMAGQMTFQIKTGATASAYTGPGGADAGGVIVVLPPG